jgi:dephospho-CoA kinase
MRVLGLTGSMGMGKSTTAAMFAQAGVPVYDADAAVHALYAGAAAPLIEAAFPGTTADGRVDREKLGRAVVGRPESLKVLETIVHPLVRAREIAFRDAAAKAGHQFVLLDIPLLFETGGDARVDAVVVVTAPADIQRARVLARPGMTPERLDALLARQMPDAEKRRRAHFLVETGRGLQSAREQVFDILRAFAGR